MLLRVVCVTFLSIEAKTFSHSSLFAVRISFSSAKSCSSVLVCAAEAASLLAVEAASLPAAVPACWLPQAARENTRTRLVKIAAIRFILKSPRIISFKVNNFRYQQTLGCP